MAKRVSAAVKTAPAQSAPAQSEAAKPAPVERPQSKILCGVERDALSAVVARMRQFAELEDPHHAYVDIDVEPGRVRLTVTAEGYAHAATVPVAIETFVRSGKLRLPLQRFAAWVRTDTGGSNPPPLVFEVDGDTQRVKQAGGAKFVVAPRLPPPLGAPTPESDDSVFVLKCTDFVRMANRSTYAVSSDDTRPHLTVVVLHGDGHVAWADATDGHRLARVAVPLVAAQSSVKSRKIGLPVSLLGAVAAACRKVHAGTVTLRQRPGAGAWVTVERADRHGAHTEEFFSADGGRGELGFPSVEQVIPAQCERSVEIDVAALSAAIKKVMSGADSIAGVKFILGSESGTVSYENTDTESTRREDIDYSKVQGIAHGDTSAFRINARYLRDTLDSFGGRVTMEMSGGELDPIVIRPVGGVDIAVIMPMRL